MFPNVWITSQMCDSCRERRSSVLPIDGCCHGLEQLRKQSIPGEINKGDVIVPHSWLARQLQPQKIALGWFHVRHIFYWGGLQLSEYDRQIGNKIAHSFFLCSLVPNDPWTGGWGPLIYTNVDVQENTLFHIKLHYYCFFFRITLELLHSSSKQKSERTPHCTVAVMLPENSYFKYLFLSSCQWFL